MDNEESISAEFGILHAHRFKGQFQEWFSLKRKTFSHICFHTQRNLRDIKPVILL